MEESNVNNLNGIPNFGHGLPEDGIVQAGITDIAQIEISSEEETEEIVVKKSKKSVAE